jgi:hypothetical protein
LNLSPKAEAYQNGISGRLPLEQFLGFVALLFLHGDELVGDINTGRCWIRNSLSRSPPDLAGGKKNLVSAETYQAQDRQIAAIPAIARVTRHATRAQVPINAETRNMKY